MSDSISGYGGITGSDQVLTLTTDGGGVLDYAFDMYTIPDRFIVSYAGSVLVDTGFVSNSRTGQIAVPLGYSNQVDVVVLSNSTSTLWSYTVTAQAQFPTSPLDVSIIGNGSWSAPDAHGNVSYSGAVDIGYGGGPALLEVDGATVTLENGMVAVSAGAVVLALTGSVSPVLFTGAFDINDATGLITPLAPAAVDLLAGSTLTVTAAQLQQTELGLAYSLTLPGWLQPLAIGSTLPAGTSSIFLGNQAIALGQLGSLTAIAGQTVAFFDDFTAALADLTLSSDPAADQLTLTGALTTASPFGTGAPIGLAFSGPGGIDISGSGAISLAGSLTAGTDWTIAPGFEIDDVTLQIDPTTAAISGAGTLKLAFGTGSVSLPTALAFTTNPWLLDPIEVNTTIAAGLDIPGTPFVLTSLVGEVDNVAAGAVAPVDLNGTFGLTVGPPGGSFDLLQLAVTGTATYGAPLAGAISGYLGVAGYTALATVAGYGTFDWTHGAVAASLQANVLSGLFAGTIALAGDAAGFDLYGTGIATLPAVASINGVDLTLPALIGGGTTIPYATLQATYIAGAPLASDYLTLGWTQTIALADFAGNPTSTTQTVGIQIPFAGAPSVVGVTPLATYGTVQASGTITDSATYTVPSYTGLLLLTADFANAGGTAALSVIEPGGAIIAAADFDANGIFDVPTLDGAGAQTVAIIDPAAGSWQLEVDNTDTVGAVSFSATGFAASPSLTLATPIASGTGWSFTWQATDLPANATITFYAGSPASPLAGLPISAPLAATPTGSFVWDGSSVAPGAYAIYAVLAAPDAVPADAAAPGGPVSVDTTTSLAVSLSGPASVAAGSTTDITLLLDIVNSGTAIAAGAVASVTIPAGFTPDISQTTLVQTDAGWTVPIGALAPGQEIDIPLLLTPSGTATGGLSSFAAAVSSSTALSGAAAASLALPTLSPPDSGFDLLPSHLDIGTTAAAGGTLTYVLELSNLGNAAATSYNLTETVGGAHILGAAVLPGASDLTAAVADNTLDDVLTLSGASLAAGGEVQVAVTLQPFGATPVIGTAAVQSAQGAALQPADAVQVDVLGSGSTQLVSPADLSLGISANAGTVKIGGSIGFTATVTNNGPDLASGVAIEIALPDFLSATGGTSVQGSYSPATGLWTVGNLPDGTTRTLTIQATATAAVGGGQSPTSTAAATASVVGLDETDPNLANNSAAVTVTAACFASGTRILTSLGEVPVEDLRAGMRALTVCGAEMVIEWIGTRRTLCARHPRPVDVWPVRVRAGAFAATQPHRDLLLSPDHAVYLDGALIPIRHLVNGVSIVQEATPEVTYWHVELARHDVILAEGLPCESYLDTGNRTAFAGTGTVIDLHPDFAHYVWEAEGCAPLVVCGPKLAAARRQVLAQAKTLPRVNPAATLGSDPHAA